MKSPFPEPAASRSQPVYLSYNSREAPAVEQIANRLREDGIDVWLDRWRIKPGDRWQDLVVEARRSPIWVVFLGPEGLGPQHGLEVKESLWRAQEVGKAGPEETFLAIPVLLPGLSEEQRQDLPPLFRELYRVEFQQTGDESAYGRLLSALRARLSGDEGRRTLRGHSGAVMGVAFSPDGRFLASVGEDATARLWDAPDWGSRDPLRVHKLGLRCVAFSPDGRYLAAGSRDGTVTVLHVETGKRRWQLAEHRGSVNAVAFSPEGNPLASGGEDGSICLWEPKEGTVLRRFKNPSRTAVNALAWSPDGAFLASGAQDKLIQFWNLGKGRALSPCKGHTDIVWSIAFSADGRLLASAGSDRTIRLWEIAGAAERWCLRGHDDVVLGVAITPDGRHLVSGGADGTVRTWSLETGEQREQWRLSTGWVYGVAVSPDGRTIAGALDDEIAIWNWREQPGPPHPPPAGSVGEAPEGRIAGQGGLLPADIARDPGRLAEVLARLAFLDRSRLRLCEAPDAASVSEALRAAQAHEPDFEERLRETSSGFGPNALWKAWMAQVHGERLRQIGQELLSASPAAAPQEPPAAPPSKAPVEEGAEERTAPVRTKYK